MAAPSLGSLVRAALAQAGECEGEGDLIRAARYRHVAAVWAGQARERAERLAERRSHAPGPDADTPPAQTPQEGTQGPPVTPGDWMTQPQRDLIARMIDSRPDRDVLRAALNAEWMGGVLDAARAMSLIEWLRTSPPPAPALPVTGSPERTMDSPSPGE